MDVIILLLCQQRKVAIMVEPLLQTLDHSRRATKSVDSLLQLGLVCIQILDASVYNGRKHVAWLHNALLYCLLKSNTENLPDRCKRWVGSRGKGQPCRGAADTAVQTAIARVAAAVTALAQKVANPG